MSTLFFIFGIMIVSLVGITLVSALERRLVWPYVAPDAVPPERCPPPTAYAQQAAQEATAAGFAWLGTFADGKGKLYRLRYDFFRSPDGDLLALVGSGAVASVPVQTTWLYTLLAEGRCLVTVDHQNGGETDLAGLSEETLIAGHGFVGQVAAHRARIAGSARPVLPFEAVDPLIAFRAYRQNRTQRLVHLGYATFLDPERAQWRYSLKGAATLAFRQYFTGLRRAVVPDTVRVAPADLLGSPGGATGVPAPPFVQATALLVCLYALLLLVNSVVFALLTHRWVLLWVGFSQAFTGLWLMSSLFQLKRWAWWWVVVSGVLIGLRDLVGLLADTARLIKHIPLPHPQFLPVHVLSLLVWLVVVRLLMRPSRAAFGLSKAAEVGLDPQGPDPPQAGVWPPPPSVPRR